MSLEGKAQMHGNNFERNFKDMLDNLEEMKILSYDTNGVKMIN